MILSLILSLYLYISVRIRLQNSKNSPLLAMGGNSGNIIYDFYIGHELNPRIGNFDWKVFSELRPGLIFWILINLSMLVKQYEVHGWISLSMIFVFIFQFIYVFDALYNEPSILTTMDVTTDGFGFMLVFGDFVWVPFTYSLQCRYLVYHSPTLSPTLIAIILFTQAVGFYIFRASNSTKDTFRTNPNCPSVKHIKYINTERGTRLMTSSWWGAARHINYFGDWLMSVSWCLPCGFSTPIAYFYSLYFALLLAHRERRDDHSCSKKYGKDWDKYCSIVKSRIIPYIY